MPSPLIDPIVLEGRLPHASPDPDVIEIVLREDFQREFDVPLGSEFPVQFLSEADYFRFDTGFEGGEVHGPRPCSRSSAPCGWPAASPRCPRRSRARPPSSRIPTRSSAPATSSGSTAAARATRSWRPRIEDLVGDRTLPPEAEEFSVVDVSDTSIAAASVDNTALLLGRALMLLALSTAVVGGVAVTQALARHHTATAAPARSSRRWG